MNVKEAIQKRRAYRALEPVEITDELIQELAGAAHLMCSCFNNQPWRYVFVRSKEALEKVCRGLSSGNDWARNASLIIAVFAHRDHDCVVKEREYYLFDLGMATGSMVLRATELGLVAHPIAGFDSEIVSEVLGIPDEYLLITLVNVGKKSDTIDGLSPKHAELEKKRPERMPLDNIYSIDYFDERLARRPGE